jgi:predicted DNA-binding protein (MmcQ/YjbR family)
MSNTGSAPPGSAARRHDLALRELALAYPETHEDLPWGHRAIKVRGKKAFAFFGTDPNGLFLSVKLPESGLEALDLPFTAPTGYGLGKSGWVSARFDVDDEVPMDLLARWLDESFRAVAPKTLVKAMDADAGTAPGAATATGRASKKTPARKRPARKA